MVPGRDGKAGPHRTCWNVHVIAKNGISPNRCWNGGSITHTSELKVLNYKKATQSPDAGEWLKEIENEKARFDKYNALMPIK